MSPFGEYGRLAAVCNDVGRCSWRWCGGLWFSEDEGVECCSAQAGATITFVFRAHGRISCVCMRGEERGRTERKEDERRGKKMNGKKRG